MRSVSIRGPHCPLCDCPDCFRLARLEMRQRASGGTSGTASTASVAPEALAQAASQPALRSEPPSSWLSSPSLRFLLLAGVTVTAGLWIASQHFRVYATGFRLGIDASASIYQGRIDDLRSQMKLN